MTLLEVFTLFFYHIQARVVAFDGGSPAKSSTVTAILNILRNLNNPVFDKKIYNVTIFETHPLRKVVTKIRASDVDRQVGLNGLYI